MNKYLNIILISFFSVLTYQYKISFSFYIPIVFFLTNYNQKNIFLILPISAISFYFTNSEHIIYLLVLYIFIAIYFIFLKSRKSNVLDCLYIFLVNFFILLFERKSFTYREVIVCLSFSLFSMLIYLYFIYNVLGVLSKQNSFRNYGFIETIMGIAVVVGATTIKIKNINLGLFIAMFYIMYMSQNGYSLLSIFFSILTMFLLKMVFNIEEAIMLPFVSAFYMFPSVYGSIILISFCLVGWLINFAYINIFVLQVSIGIAILFEIFKYSIVNLKNNKAEIVEDVYTQAIASVNNEIIGFASFLDLYAKEFSTSKIYNKKIGDGINNLMHSYCEGCYVRKECFSKNKGKTYAYFKNMLLYSKRRDYEMTNEELISFFKMCPYIVEMRKSAILINERLNLSNESTKSNTLIAEMNGVSNILRQYSVDNTLKNEFEYDVFYKIKKAICDYGFNVCYFNPKKILINDFLIEIGIRGVGFLQMKKVLEKIGDNYIVNKTTIVFQKVEKGKTYMNMVPRVNFEVDYGYGSIAQNGNGVCGDNFLIKELNDSKLIAAISDGMGNGYLANQESNTTLKLVDKVTSTSLSTTTSLQILNTFYFIQDYLEKYSTLDFVEVDRNKGQILFYKMGASTSYLFHKNGSFEKIENENLPFGIEEIIETKNFELSDEDIIIMTSDGVFENMESDEELALYIKGIMHMSPQNITYEILKYAKEHKKKVDDDMCVITLKVQLMN